MAVNTPKGKALQIEFMKSQLMWGTAPSCFVVLTYRAREMYLTRARNVRVDELKRGSRIETETRLEQVSTEYIKFTHLPLNKYLNGKKAYYGRLDHTWKHNLDNILTTQWSRT